MFSVSLAGVAKQLDVALNKDRTGIKNTINSLFVIISVNQYVKCLSLNLLICWFSKVNFQKGKNTNLRKVFKTQFNPQLNLQ